MFPTDYKEVDKIEVNVILSNEKRSFSLAPA
jgi:hypothetical protein